nr:zinc finger protein OZF-like [Maniola hyperantus]
MAKKKQTFGEFKCKICSKVFSERAGLNHHAQLHTSDKPFSCSKCSFTCKTKKYLHRHANRVHVKHEKSNECEICGKKFFFKSLLVKHMYIHSDVRPYKCEVCDRGFNSRYSLSSHSHTHTGKSSLFIFDLVLVW